MPRSGYTASNSEACRFWINTRGLARPALTRQSTLPKQFTRLRARANNRFWPFGECIKLSPKCRSNELPITCCGQIGASKINVTSPPGFGTDRPRSSLTVTHSEQRSVRVGCVTRGTFFDTPPRTDSTIHPSTASSVTYRPLNLVLLTSRFQCHERHPTVAQELRHSLGQTIPVPSNQWHATLPNRRCLFRNERSAFSSFSPSKSGHRHGVKYSSA